MPIPITVTLSPTERQDSPLSDIVNEADRVCHAVHSSRDVQLPASANAKAEENGVEISCNSLIEIFYLFLLIFYFNTTDGRM